MGWQEPALVDGANKKLVDSRPEKVVDNKSEPIAKGCGTDESLRHVRICLLRLADTIIQQATRSACCRITLRTHDEPFLEVRLAAINSLYKGISSMNFLGMSSMNFRMILNDLLMLAVCLRLEANKYYAHKRGV